MSDNKVGYLERFLGGVDKIESGRPGGISGDRWLTVYYRPEYAPVLLRYLSYGNENVRAETVMLLTDVREPAAADAVRSMSVSDTGKVRGACIGYLNAVSDAGGRVPSLMDVLKHSRGEEFSKAASLMGSLGRKEDIDELRKIYGQVRGEMRKELFGALERIIGRYPDLGPKRDLFLSVPVPPDEDAYDRFITVSTEYLDKRYRENVSAQKKIDAKTANNVSAALAKMRTRIYNESDNLQHYGAEESERTSELTELIRWASEDLASKTVLQGGPGHLCPKCGAQMILYRGLWSCPEC
ncbi:MAG: HEAT repeat domain-containing protein [Gammaproteobacteria bacterium]|nr:HEAT repeat domain-containing protein [Gammaproteobacteria bacterium]